MSSRKSAVKRNATRSTKCCARARLASCCRTNTQYRVGNEVFCCYQTLRQQAVVCTAVGVRESKDATQWRPHINIYRAVVGVIVVAVDRVSDAKRALRLPGRWAELGVLRAKGRRNSKLEMLSLHRDVAGAQPICWV